MKLEMEDEMETTEEEPEMEEDDEGEDPWDFTDEEMASITTSYIRDHGGAIPIHTRNGYDYLLLLLNCKHYTWAPDGTPGPRFYDLPAVMTTEPRMLAGAEFFHTPYGNDYVLIRLANEACDPEDDEPADPDDIDTNGDESMNPEEIDYIPPIVVCDQDYDDNRKELCLPAASESCIYVVDDMDEERKDWVEYYFMTIADDEQHE